mgnify:CR=1 FL=1
MPARRTAPSVHGPLRRHARQARQDDVGFGDHTHFVTVGRAVGEPARQVLDWRFTALQF